MIRQTWIYLMVIVVVACNQRARNYHTNDQAKLYRLKISPIMNLKYHYVMINEAETNVGVPGQETKNIFNSEVSIDYIFSKDSSGSLLFTAQLAKIHIYTKNGDKAKVMDASNKSTTDPTTLLLGILSETPLQMSLDLNGEVQVLSGTEKISNKILAIIPSTDKAAWNIIESDWKQFIGGTFIRQNISQIFHFLPDTPVHIGTSWNSLIREQELLSTLDNTFTIKAINEVVAVIESVGIIRKSSGVSDITSLKGEQHGEYEIETKTGMVITSGIKSDLKGTIIMSGTEVPIEIKSSAKIKGKRT